MDIRGLGAIHVEWRGKKFRSTTEAIYAAFFDILGLQWEYEPWDTLAKGWWPDFLLHSPDADDGGVDIVFVEVKPVFVFDKMAKHAVEKARKAISAADDDVLDPVNNCVLWLAPAEISGHLTGWTCAYRIRYGDRYATWDAAAQPADLAEMFVFMGAGDGKGRPPHAGGQLALEDIWEGSLDSAEPDYPNLWSQASRTIKLEARPAVAPWHPKDDPAPAKCDGGADCECDSYSDAHECPVCGNFKRRQFDTCFSCR